MNGGTIQDDFRSVWNRPNNAVAQIIVINAIVFVITGVMFILGFSEYVRPYLGVTSNLNVLPTRIWTIVTYMFVHDGFFHILFNMLWFYWFGKLIQEFLGSDKVIAIYALGGLFGVATFIIAYNLMPGYEEIAKEATLVGASAGVTAAIVGAAVFMPNYTMYLLLIGPVKIKYIALVSVFLILMGTRGQTNVGGEFAHLGGAVAGWLYISQIRKGNDIGAWVIKSLNFFKALFKPQPKIRVTHRSRPQQAKKRKGSSSAPKSSGTSQEEIDAILDKISQNGYESLSKEEKQKLFNASK